MKKTKADDGYVSLREACESVRQSHPWLPTASLRQAVREGLIPYKRASLSKRSKYFVRMPDVLEYISKLSGGQQQ